MSPPPPSRPWLAGVSSCADNPQSRVLRIIFKPAKNSQSLTTWNRIRSWNDELGANKPSHARHHHHQPVSPILCILFILTRDPSSPRYLPSPSRGCCYTCNGETHVSLTAFHNTFADQCPRHIPGTMYAPNQDKTQGTGVLSINVLLRIAQQDVHVGIDALQRALVLGLAPLQADDELGADSVEKEVSIGALTGEVVVNGGIFARTRWVEWKAGAWGVAYLACKNGRGLTGWNCK